MPNLIENGMVAGGTLESEKKVAMVVYALQAASFLLGITYLIALIVDYAKRDDVAGTWLESHFRWQIRTFWYSLLWFTLAAMTYVVLIGFFIGHFLFMAVGAWVIYRIARGWLRLMDNKPMYA